MAEDGKSSPVAQETVEETEGAPDVGGTAVARDLWGAGGWWRGRNTAWRSIVAWVVVYNVVGPAMHANYLPWT